MPHPNQYTKNPRGLGEYCPRIVIRMSEDQAKQFAADVKASGIRAAHYARCKLGLEDWPNKDEIPSSQISTRVLKSKQ